MESMRSGRRVEFGRIEIDAGGLDHAGAASGAVLPGPVHVGVGDHLVGRWEAVVSEVLGGVRVADEDGVVAAGERAVDRRADASIGLCAGDNESTYTALCELGFQ